MSQKENILFGDRNQRLHAALKMFGRTLRDLEQDLNIMKQWLKTQRHLPETPSDCIITNMLITNKFSIEKCKENMDMYYTMRTMIPDIFRNKNPKLPNMKTAAKVISYVPMPKLTEEGYRVTVVRMLSPDAEYYIPLDVSGHCINICELRLINDVMMGDIYVVDMGNYTLSHISRINVVFLKKLFTVIEKVYKNILKQTHFINVPPYVESLISMIKQVAKPKLASRIFAHRTGDNLKNYLPNDVLPKEYGGTENSLDELNDLWLREIEKHQYRFDELAKLEVDESKRPGKLINDDLLGFHGNFKKLNVD